MDGAARSTSELLDELLPDDRVIADVRGDLARGGLRDEEPEPIPPPDVAMSVMSKAVVRMYYAAYEGWFRMSCACQVSVGAMHQDSAGQPIPEFCYARVR